MAFQPVPNCAEIDIIYTLNGVIVQNSFYAFAAGGYALGDLVTLAAAIDNEVDPTWLTQQPAEAIYVRTEVRGLNVENDLTAEDSFSAGPGLHVGSPLPNNVTFSIKKTSGLTGRSARGRTYWIGVPRTQLDAVNENLVLAAFASAVVSAVGAMRLVIDALPAWAPVLVSRFTAGAQRPVGVTFPWVGETNIDLRVDTLRNRLPTL